MDTPESFIWQISFLGIVQGNGVDGEVTWSQEGEMVVGHWEGLTRYTIPDGGTYVGFHNEYGWNGRMIQYVNTFCTGRINKHGIQQSEYWDSDMTMAY